jgi:hypothetical protein
VLQKYKINELFFPPEYIYFFISDLCFIEINSSTEVTESLFSEIYCIIVCKIRTQVFNGTVVIIHTGGCKILIRRSVFGFSNLSGLNPLTNRVLNKNIKIISFIY